MKTLDELLADRDVVAAVQALAAHGCRPDQAAELLDRMIAHGTRRMAREIVERDADVLRGLERA